MNRDRSYGVWKQARGKLRQLWGMLAGDPLSVAAGARDHLSGRNQEQRGVAKQEADRQLEDFRNRNRDWSNLRGR
jgi:uncharacterized protein YjbJ (UPF0337 family)